MREGKAEKLIQKKNEKTEKLTACFGGMSVSMCAWERSEIFSFTRRVGESWLCPFLSWTENAAPPARTGFSRFRDHYKGVNAL